MTHYSSSVDFRCKKRIPTSPVVFDKIGYDRYRYPFVDNYTSIYGYSIFVKKTKIGYCIYTDGWIYNSTPEFCLFESFGIHLHTTYDSLDDALEEFAIVSSMLCFCYNFRRDFKHYYDYIRERAEIQARLNHSEEIAQKVIADKFESYQYELGV